MSSFVRQLNMYDFHKRQKTRDVLVFFHDFFKRDNRQLLQHIKRKTNPNYGTTVPRVTPSLMLPRSGADSRNDHA